MSRKSLAVPMKATNNKPKKPLGLQNLNDDCLIEIMSYMSLEDIYKLARLNRRFLAIAPLKTVAKKCHSINGCNIDEYDDDLLEDFFKALATKCGSLELVGFDKYQFETCLSSLQNLTELSLKDISPSIHNIQSLPQKLKSLTLDRCNFKKGGGSESRWFEGLSPTLNQLTIKSTTVRGLDHLKNLTHFHIDGHFAWSERSRRKYYYEDDYEDDYDLNEEEEMIKDMLGNNRDSLKSLNLLPCNGNIRKFRGLGKFKNLETLSMDLKLFGKEEDVTVYFFGICCEKIVNLTIHCCYRSPDSLAFEGDKRHNPVTGFLEYLNCERTLETMTIHFDWWMYVDFPKLTALRHLELRGGTCIPNLRHQTKLETLVMCRIDVRNFSVFSEMELPLESLRTLTLQDISASRDLECFREEYTSRAEELRSWLESEVPAECKWEFSYRQ